jgi:hypothetical protein
MFSQRWYRFVLAGFISAIVVSAFYAGRYSMRDYSISLEQISRTPEKNNPSQISSIAVGAMDSEAPPKPQNLEQRWSELSAQPATPSGENELAALIEKMAEQEPQRAISLAVAQTNLRLRAALLRSALKGWGSTDPEAAVVWTQSETAMDQGQAINALLQGAVRDPDKAINVTDTLIQNDSTRAGEFGGDLVSALTESGQFERAADFAASGPANRREDWILPAYSRWAEFQPQAAAASAMQIADPGLRATALNAVTIGWSPTDPKGVVDFARNNLPPEQQNAALSGALGLWADNDPAAAAAWINQNNPGEASDTGAARIAISSLLSQRPEVAFAWAEKIISAPLREETLTAVVDQLESTDPVSAENYIEHSATLTPEDRAPLLAHLKKQFEP